MRFLSGRVEMFGYVTINKAEMKFKEFDVYHGYYCGLCKNMEKSYGPLGQMTLSYDMTFAALLLSSLYETEVVSKMTSCIAHPFEKHLTYDNEIIKYIADMNVILAMYKCQDDWNDEKKLHKKIYGDILKSLSKKQRKLYKEKETEIKDLLDKMSECEKASSTDVDYISGLFGNIMGVILTYKNDEWSDCLRKLGFYLGKFVYILDAYEDLDKDKKKGNYNPFLSREHTEEFEEEIKMVLTLMMSECCKAFEQLPILENAQILRNILYSGVWSKYEIIRNRDKK